MASGEPVNALPFKELIIVFVGLVLGVFLAALDQTIASVCTTKIANEFKALNDVARIGTSYLLTAIAFQPLYGRFSDIFGRKSVFLFAIIVFLGGSALFDAAQSMAMMIVARGISGVGAGGIVSRVMIIITDLVVRPRAWKVPGDYRYRLWAFFYYWTTSWMYLYRPCFVVLGFLYQPGHWCHHPRRRHQAPPFPSRRRLTPRKVQTYRFLGYPLSHRRSGPPPP